MKLAPGFTYLLIVCLAFLVAFFLLVVRHLDTYEVPSIHLRDVLPNKTWSILAEIHKLPCPVSSRGSTLLPCDWTPQTLYQPSRSLCFLQCSSRGSAILYKEVTVEGDNPVVTSLYSKDVWCLKRVVKSACSDAGLRVPRLAHYVHFGAFNMTIDAFISVLAVSRFLKPCLVLYHADTIPHGPYWRALLHLVPNIVHVQTSKPTRIFKNIINVVEHSADVKRLQVLIEYGGVYLDPDYFVLRTLYDLRNESTVIGMEGHQICNGFIVAEPNASFIRIWLDNYRDFSDSSWTGHSGSRPFQLSKRYPRLVKVVTSFFNPMYSQTWAYFDRKKVPKFDWHSIYGLHLYTRMVHDKVFKGKRLDKQDNAIGDVIRHVLYGDQFACMSTWKVP